MFTILQIQQAHSKVRSGADFPGYVASLIAIGVLRYETFVADGHSRYYGENGFSIASAIKYPALLVAPTSDAEVFKKYLKHHQQGHSDYLTFCQQAAASGVEKWVVDTKNRSCIYLDAQRNEMLVETIPQVK